MIDYGTDGGAGRSRFTARPKQHTTRYANQLIATHGQEAAFKLAARLVHELETGLKEGVRTEVMSSKEIQRNLGFWRSIRGYLSREKKRLKAS